MQGQTNSLENVKYDIKGVRKKLSFGNQSKNSQSEEDSEMDSIIPLDPENKSPYLVNNNQRPFKEYLSVNNSSGEYSPQENLDEELLAVSCTPPNKRRKIDKEENNASDSSLESLQNNSLKDQLKEIIIDNKLTEHEFNELYQECFGSKHKEEKMPKDSNYDVHSQIISKSTIQDFLSRILNTENSPKILTDLIFEGEKKEFLVVGRPEVHGSSTKQMRHITPYSFVTTLIDSVIKESATTKILINNLTKYLIVFLRDQKGFCFNSKDLNSSPYKEIKAKVSQKPHKLITKLQKENIDTQKIYSEEIEKIFITPTKKAKAAQDYSEYNPYFIKAAMDKLSEALQDANTSTMAAEIITRYMYIIYNKKLYTAFAEEGNTLSYEIRYYEDTEEAKKYTKKYTIITAKELKDMQKKFSENEEEIELLNYKIRIVDCEGYVTKQVKDVLSSLNKMIKQYREYDKVKKISLEEYNTKYNKALTLANYVGKLKNYKEEFNQENFKATVPQQLAKWLYFVFDFKALEDDVFVATRENEKTIIVYPSASGLTTSKYGILDGAKYRATKINEGRGYNTEEVYRREEVDPGFLIKKLVEHFIISTISYAEFHIGPDAQDLSSDYIKILLNAFVELAKLDHAIVDEEFNEKTISLYDKLINNSSILSNSEEYEVSFVGDDNNNQYNNIFNNEH